MNRYPAARAYVKRIKNASKRAYAHAYYTYCLGLNDEPARETFRLSDRAAQAVRHRLAELGMSRGC